MTAITLESHGIFFSQFRHWKGKSASLSLSLSLSFSLSLSLCMYSRNGCNSGNGRLFLFSPLSMESPLRPESATSKALVPNYNYYRPGGRAITIQREIKTGGKYSHRNVEHRIDLNGSNITRYLLYRKSCRKYYPLLPVVINVVVAFVHQEWSFSLLRWLTFEVMF